MARYNYGESSVDLNNPRLATTKILERVGTDKIILELGVNNGYLSKHFTERGCKVTGIERDSNAAKEAEKHCERVLVRDLNDFDLNDLAENRFHCIVAADVLEHLVHPDKLLDKLRPFLMNNGCVIASIPNITHGSLALEILKGNFRYNQSGLTDDSHLRFFSETGVFQLFQSAGYFIEILDRVMVPMGSTEYDRYSLAARDELMEFLSRNRNCSVYQFVVVARPATEVQTIKGLTAELKELHGSEIHQLVKTINYWRREFSLLQERCRQLELSCEQYVNEVKMLRHKPPVRPRVRLMLKDLFRLLGFARAH